MPARKPVKNKPPIVAKLEEISAVEPLPFEGGKGFSYVAEAAYLPFLAPDDSYARLLLQSRLLSNTHNACINTKKDYCAGNGFQTKEEEDITDKKFQEWIKSMNLKDESATEINRQIFESFFTFGNVPIELVRFTVGNKKYFFIYIHNLLEWRLGKPNDDGISTYAIQSKLFLRDGFVLEASDYENSRKLPLYSPRKGNKVGSDPIKNPRINWVRDSNGTERTMIWYRNSICGFPNYGLPTAVASLIYQKSEYGGARFNLDNLENGMALSAILAIKGNLGEKELDRIGKRILKQHAAPGKRGRVMVIGSEEGVDGSDFHPIDTHKDGSYSQIDDIWTQKIILANQWDAVLAGIISSKTLGKGMGYLTKIIESKKNTVMIPAQTQLVDKFWRTTITLAKEWLGMSINPDDVQIRNTIDISGLTDVDITPAVTVDEVRQAKGLPEAKDKTKGKQFLGEVGADQKKGVYVKESKKKKNVPEK
jgi:hypothetical protein